MASTFRACPRYIRRQKIHGVRRLTGEQRRVFADHSSSRAMARFRLAAIAAAAALALYWVATFAGTPSPVL